MYGLILLSGKIKLIVSFTGHKDMGTQVVKVTELKSEVLPYLHGGCHGLIGHQNSYRVIKAAGFKPEAISDLRGHLEAAMASEAKLIFESNFHCPVACKSAVLPRGWFVES